MFRWLIVPIGKELLGAEHAGRALSMGLVCLVLPYIFLAAPAGYLADRFSKRAVILGCKVAEVGADDSGHRLDPAGEHLPDVRGA